MSHIGEIEDNGYLDDGLTYEERYERDSQHTDEIVLICDTPGCLMPGEHFPSECHTVEDMERMHSEALLDQHPQVALAVQSAYRQQAFYFDCARHFVRSEIYRLVEITRKRLRVPVATCEICRQPMYYSDLCRNCIPF